MNTNTINYLTQEELKELLSKVNPEAPACWLVFKFPKGNITVKLGAPLAP